MKFKSLISVSLILTFFIVGVRAIEPVYEEYFVANKLKAAQTIEADKMENAHNMARSARLLGLSEDSETIQTAKNIWTAARASHDLLAQQIETVGELPAELPYDAFTTTGISSEGFDAILVGTGLEGCGVYFQEVESQYGINGLFAVSVAKVESNLGESNLAKKKNNFFGMLGCSFSSKEEGILAFGELISESSYYQGKTIEQIAKTYCPPTWSKWAGDVKWCMEDFWDKLVIQD